MPRPHIVIIAEQVFMLNAETGDLTVTLPNARVKITSVNLPLYFNIKSTTILHLLLKQYGEKKANYADYEKNPPHSPGANKEDIYKYIDNLITTKHEMEDCLEIACQIIKRIYDKRLLLCLDDSEQSILQTAFENTATRSLIAGEDQLKVLLTRKVEDDLREPIETVIENLEPLTQIFSAPKTKQINRTPREIIELIKNLGEQIKKLKPDHPLIIGLEEFTSEIISLEYFYNSICSYKKEPFNVVAYDQDCYKALAKLQEQLASTQITIKTFFGSRSTHETELALIDRVLTKLYPLTTIDTDTHLYHSLEGAAEKTPVV